MWLGGVERKADLRMQRRTEDGKARKKLRKILLTQTWRDK